MRASVSLLDITPSTIEVPVGDGESNLLVRGLGITDLSYLIQVFPEVKDLFAGKDANITVDDLITRSPILVGAIIACGAGNRGSEAATVNAQGLPLSDQVAILNAIIDQTFKGGIGPFVNQVQRLLGLAVEVGTKVSASNGRKPSSS